MLTILPIRLGGYLFEDMDSEQEEDDQATGNHGQWGYWPEAMDPSNNVIAHPTSEGFIASLPRKLFAEIEKTEEEMKCLVCLVKFENETVVAELPCGHVFCDSGCMELWLKQSNNCPTCRKKVSSQHITPV